MPKHAPNVLIDFTAWLLKIIGIGLAILIGLGAVIGSGVWAWNWWTYERPKAQLTGTAVPEISTKENDPLGIRCDQEFPIRIRVKNNSSRTVSAMRIELSAFLPNRSTNILTSMEDDVEDDVDFIVPPGRSFSRCYASLVREDFKADPALPQAVYKVSVSWVRFE